MLAQAFMCARNSSRMVAELRFGSSGLDWSFASCAFLLAQPWLPLPQQPWAPVGLAPLEQVGQEAEDLRADRSCGLAQERTHSSLA